MPNLPNRAFHPLAICSVLLFAQLLAGPRASLAQVPLAPHGHAGSAKACQPVDVEAKKHRHESETLGARHADQHAHMRLVQCEVERGVRKVPAAGIVKSADQTLKDDEAAKQAAFKIHRSRLRDL
ncbi:MAG: hypothetical protein H7238_04915, partial [Polaromonas sp.]|nr:hypothetical protein [Polaromonas sp.]